MKIGKIFPLKLPQNYHGPIKHFETNTQKYIKRSSQRDQYDEPSKNISRWQRKISDFDVLQQRKQYLVHPAKISRDNPDWLKSTYHYYHRSQPKPSNSELLQDRKKFDVFGQQKMDLTNKQAQSALFIRKQQIKKQMVTKIGTQGSVQLVFRRSRMAQEVTGKIGSVQGRLNLIRRPQLKIGSLYQSNYVNTYTVD